MTKRQRMESADTSKPASPSESTPALESKDSDRPKHTPGICAFWIKKKARYCKWEVRHDGDPFCSNHTESKQRVPCPLDPAHSVFKYRLRQHLKICNKMKQDNVQKNYKFYSENVNVDVDPTTSTEIFTSLKQVDSETMKSVITKLDKAVKELEFEVPLQSGTELGLPAEISAEISQEEKKAGVDENTKLPMAVRKSRTFKKIKNEVQQKAILEHTFKHAYESGIPDHICFVEMGAAKGGLSVATRNMLKQSDKEYTDISHVLIDRGSFKVRDDREMTGNKDESWERVKIDLRHLKLYDIDKVSNAENVIVYSKHLCGAATCYALRSCVGDQGDSKNDGVKSKQLPQVISIALCCHQVCNWDSYPNRALLSNRFNISRYEFDIIRHMSSWATCGFEKSVETEHASISDEQKQLDDTGPEWFFNVQEKEMIGKQCKMLLNYGRVLYLRDHGYNASLIRYATDDITIENVLLLAYLHKA
uniref:tRNA:m(4)X modification enzyme TRM13 n=1 Tax=Aplanochytrium stocchinoi TaxID=215587 RepID=A0A7S3LJX6_9STRA